ncbi:SusC/RagA family TonB-linked outer membrane protein [Sphingobacterium gobiense]|uniref:SusC/RagA family TonB-linked outer membrane protein n=1 Tax=Sphingobacterium gobiense TaxID=1382456 RepID=A0A2S9JCW8_9SPHI|nr:TonB-dependent receptor [Sphingobacterium gobiense]PRD50688.1 SusC/RagA family TonB-linked outer membrane protein [Sphingobacterium gobiense]
MKKQQFYRHALLLVMLFVSSQVWAQTIRGSVVSADTDEPLTGASIQVKGQQASTATDSQGNFMLDAPAGATLVVSYVGYQTQEIQVSEGETLLIRLMAEASDLEQVVVIGYGAQKKKLNTGANLRVEGADLEKRNQLNPLQALQGQAPGVSITANSGQPGADMKVVVRGLGTIGNSGPLYVIDGIPGGDISILNPADIVSIDVLKDAASAAIYGSQAANGVVLVTTKMGRSGKTQLAFDAFGGVQNVGRRIPLLNADQYKTIMNEQALNTGSALIDFDGMEGLADTDWLDYMFTDDAKMQNYNLGLTGGSENSVYAMSLNYIGQEGIAGGRDVSNYERYGFRINSEHKLLDQFLTIGQHLNFNYIRNNGINVGNQYNNTLRGAFATSPLSPVYSSNGRFGSPYNDTSNSPWYNGDGNPYGAMMTNSNNQNDAQRMLADIYAEIELIPGLKIKTIGGFNYSASEYRSFTPLYQFSAFSYNLDHTTVNQNMGKGNTLTWTNTATYDFNVATDHQFTAMVGMESQRYQGTYLSGSNWNLLSQFNDFAHAYLDNTTGQAHLDDEGNIVETRFVNGRPENMYRRVSYFGRLGYNFKEKYLLNATLRADGSSKFAKDNRWGYFPSVSAGWILSAEEFFAPWSSSVNFLKLRASWGQVGNQDIADFQFASPINTSTGWTADNPAAHYVFGTGNVNVPGAYPSRLSNPLLTWETSEQTNVGLDAKFLDNRLDLVADFYIKNTKNWLVQPPILATAGAGAPFINGGSVRNTGVELGLAWNDRIGEVSYRAGINGAYNKNRVGSIPTEDGIIHGEINMLFDNSEEFYRAQNGHAIGYFWGYQTDGLFQSEADIASWRDQGRGILQPNVKPGDVKYVDQNGDGRINALDKIDLGVGLPNFTFGFNVGVNYKNFDFSLDAYGVTGNKIVQSLRNHANKQANYTTQILDRWTGEGTSNSIPRVTETNVNWQFSDLYLQDGDFLRIANVTLGYDFSKLTTWKYANQIRLYVQGQNLFTFTKYDGMDPEIGYGTSGWVSGIDLGYYPRPKVVLFGLNVKF